MNNIGDNFAEGFANVVAGIATGQVGFAAVGGLLLNTLADLTGQLGKAAIQIGITMKAIKLSFKNPFAAIAAGVGLLAVSAILRSVAGNFSGGDAPKFADGGIVGGSSFFGDKILARLNSGELVLNQKQQQSVYGLMNQSQPIVIGGTIEASGDKLQVILDRTDKRKSRNG